MGVFTGQRKAVKQYFRHSIQREPMNKPILQLHEEMVRVIGRFDGETTGTAKTDHCYRIAADYWQLAKEEIRVNGFPHAAAEIDFFRNQKTKFTGLLEYYLLLFRYQIHSNAGNAVLEQFRREETDRSRKIPRDPRHFYQLLRGSADRLGRPLFPSPEASQGPATAVPSL